MSDTLHTLQLSYNKIDTTYSIGDIIEVKYSKGVLAQVDYSKVCLILLDSYCNRYSNPVEVKNVYKITEAEMHRIAGTDFCRLGKLSDEW